MVMIVKVEIPCSTALQTACTMFTMFKIPWKLVIFMALEHGQKEGGENPKMYLPTMYQGSTIPSMPAAESAARSRQVLRLTQKVRREYEHPESAQLNFEATFCGIFSLWLPCWAQIWIVQHINSVFLMRNRIHTQNSQRNHLLSLIPSFGTLFDKWISHIHRMDLSFAGVLFLYNSTLQLVRLTWNDHTSENAVF